ncbi:MAG: hypothetical protein GY753_17000 [Gammaproteobacteria bacterium]|nr:hypothetical protein [Gammaproteobacteria bacterium]
MSAIFERRISAGIEDLGITIDPLHLDAAFDDLPADGKVWVIKDAWTTHNGNWRKGQGTERPHIWNRPLWAKADYLLPSDHECNFDDAGADHHLFGAAVWRDFTGGNVGCRLIKGAGMHFWTWPDNSNHAGVDTKTGNGWANIPLSKSSSFNPDQTQGPWSWKKYGISDVAKGGGLPWSYHVTSFIVWSEMTKDEYVTLFLQPDYDNPDTAALIEGMKAQCIQLQPGAALQTAIAKDNRTPVSSEYSFHAAGVKFNAMLAEHLTKPGTWAYYTNADDGLWHVQSISLSRHRRLNPPSTYLTVPEDAAYRDLAMAWMNTGEGIDSDIHSSMNYRYDPPTHPRRHSSNKLVTE